jgi:hypothetical protein
VTLAAIAYDCNCAALEEGWFVVFLVITFCHG